MFGSWNFVVESKQEEERMISLFGTILNSIQQRSDTSYQTGIIPIDNDDETLSFYCGDNNHDGKMDDQQLLLPCPPEKLPAIILVIRRSSMQAPEFRYLSSLKPEQILSLWRAGQEGILSDTAKTELLGALRSFGLLAKDLNDTSCPVQSFDQTLRIFVAGDRMSVGKTSVCLGILGNLVSIGYQLQF